MKHRAHGAPASCLRRGLIVIMTLSCIILNSTTYTETKTAWNNSTDQLYSKPVKKCNKISNNCNNNPDHVNYHFKRPDPSGEPPALQRVSMTKSNVNYHFKRPDPSGKPPAFQKVSMAKSKMSLLAPASKTVKTDPDNHNNNHLIYLNYYSRPSVTWMFQGISINKLAHMLNGNKNRSYNIGMWNCRKGLINKENLPTTKIVDVKDFLSANDLQILCLIEADLHGITSRVKRIKPITSREIEENLKVENYKTLLPQSWQAHGQARILLYVRDDINLKVKPLTRSDTDLPSVSCEIGVGREKKTRVNFFYREWTSGVSGLGDNGSQGERLKRQINHWKTLHTGGRDTIILGDANLCALKWEEEDFHNKEIALQVQEYLAVAG